MSVRFEATRPGAEEPRAKRSRTARPPINIQDSFLFGSLKEGRRLAFGLVTGKAVSGRILRFDRYVVLVESEGTEVMLYKHAIVAITDAT